MSCKQNDTLTHDDDDDDESEIKKKKKQQQPKKTGEEECAPTLSHTFQVSQNTWCSKSYISIFKQIISWKDRENDKYILFVCYAICIYVKGEHNINNITSQNIC